MKVDPELFEGDAGGSWVRRWQRWTEMPEPERLSIDRAPGVKGDGVGGGGRTVTKTLGGPARRGRELGGGVVSGGRGWRMDGWRTMDGASRLLAYEAKGTDDGIGAQQ